MYSSLFWKDAFERAVKTFLQGVLAVLAVGGTTTLLTVSWPAVLSVAGTAAVVSLLTSLISAKASDTVSPASVVSVDEGV